VEKRKKRWREKLRSGERRVMEDPKARGLMLSPSPPTSMS